MLQKQIALIQKHHRKINFKMALYKKALELGSLEKAMADKEIEKLKKEIYE